MATVHPTINDQITRVQLRLLKQVLKYECFFLNSVQSVNSTNVTKYRGGRSKISVPSVRDD